MQYTLVGSARALNRVLAATLATSAVASILQLRESVGFASFMFALTALLLVGVLLCWPFAYTSIATLSFIGVATALSREDLLFAVLNAAAMASSLFVRSRLLVRVRGSGEEHAEADKP